MQRVALCFLDRALPTAIFISKWAAQRAAHGPQSCRAEMKKKEKGLLRNLKVFFCESLSCCRRRGDRQECKYSLSCNVIDDWGARQMCYCIASYIPLSTDDVTIARNLPLDGSNCMCRQLGKTCYSLYTKPKPRVRGGLQLKVCSNIL